jgi:molybdate transport system substrate-binding protein
MARHALLLSIAAALLSSCAARQAAPAKLTVAAAANLTSVFEEVGRAFREKTGVETVFSYGSTAQLAQQIENGAPFDVFAAADTEHVDGLIAERKLSGGTRAVYALGQLALWAPETQSGIGALKDLTAKNIRFVAVAQPDLAPYGQAALQAIRSAGFWPALQPKLVYAGNIVQAKQFASSGNADAAFTAYSLVLHEQGSVLKVDPRLYHPIEQALAIVASSAHIGQAMQFRAFLLGAQGRAILVKNGYLAP